MEDYQSFWRNNLSQNSAKSKTEQPVLSLSCASPVVICES
jgi:hypothetical protein